ncbi:MAG: oxygen-dependent coproporphyrinogen oxidase [Bdellovibrionaceae bacterium]|nr:oxygen-dependent coproporphyrinogen oxidase [Pseudobdellovibrionaceae bacterium]
MTNAEYEMLKEQAKEFFMNLQDEICEAFIPEHGSKYMEDLWDREGGGGGRTRIFNEGNLFEKAGVNFSEVFGQLDPKFASSMPMGEGTEFYATGVSLVMHPKNPFIPTTHANFRFIQRGNQAWFGGGADLTPYYPFEEDAQHFHQTYKDCLDSFDKDFYPKFKAECDKYFYLPHRKEMRGIGGVFFDYQHSEDMEKTFEWVQACGKSFINSYLPIVERRKGISFTEEQKEFQEIRRGRYVEFNLLYDRGTIFGLKTNGRIESILMSLPLKARWVYDHQIKVGSPEAELLGFLQPRDWAK